MSNAVVNLNLVCMLELECDNGIHAGFFYCEQEKQYRCYAWRVDSKTKKVSTYNHLTLFGDGDSVISFFLECVGNLLTIFYGETWKLLTYFGYNNIVSEDFFGGAQGNGVVARSNVNPTVTVAKKPLALLKIAARMLCRRNRKVKWSWTKQED